MPPVYEIDRTLHSALAFDATIHSVEASQQALNAATMVKESRQRKSQERVDRARRSAQSATEAAQRATEAAQMATEASSRVRGLLDGARPRSANSSSDNPGVAMENFFTSVGNFGGDVMTGVGNLSNQVIADVGNLGGEVMTGVGNLLSGPFGSPSSQPNPISRRHEFGVFPNIDNDIRHGGRSGNTAGEAVHLEPLHEVGQVAGARSVGGVGLAPLPRPQPRPQPQPYTALGEAVDGAGDRGVARGGGGTVLGAGFEGGGGAGAGAGAGARAGARLNPLPQPHTVLGGAGASPEEGGKLGNSGNDFSTILPSNSSNEASNAGNVISEVSVQEAFLFAESADPGYGGGTRGGAGARARVRLTPLPQAHTVLGGDGASPEEGGQNFFSSIGDAIGDVLGSFIPQNNVVLPAEDDPSKSQSPFVSADLGYTDGDRGLDGARDGTSKLASPHTAFDLSEGRFRGRARGLDGTGLAGGAGGGDGGDLRPRPRAGLAGGGGAGFGAGGGDRGGARGLDGTGLAGGGGVGVGQGDQSEDKPSMPHAAKHQYTGGDRGVDGARAELAGGGGAGVGQGDQSEDDLRRRGGAGFGDGFGAGVEDRGGAGFGAGSARRPSGAGVGDGAGDGYDPRPRAGAGARARDDNQDGEEKLPATVSMKSKEFDSLFFKVSDQKEYKLHYSNFDISKTPFVECNFGYGSNGAQHLINSISYSQKIDIESQRGGLFKTKSTTDSGYEEIVLIGDKAKSAQETMFNEYKKNVMEILKFKEAIKNPTLPSEIKDKLGSICKIDTKTDFNFNDISHGERKPLEEKIRELKKYLSLPISTDSRSREMETEATAYAKDLLIHQVKNNCLYIKDNHDVISEVKRVNIVRGKKDLKNKKSVIEVKFGNNCQDGDNVLVPVDDDVGLFCKVIKKDSSVKMEYFVRNDKNELQSIELKKSNFSKIIQYKDGEKLDITSQRKILKLIDDYKVEVSFVEPVKNFSKTLTPENTLSSISVGFDASDPLRAINDEAKINIFDRNSIPEIKKFNLSLENAESILIDKHVTGQSSFDVKISDKGKITNRPVLKKNSKNNIIGAFLEALEFDEDGNIKNNNLKLNEEVSKKDDSISLLLNIKDGNGKDLNRLKLECGIDKGKWVIKNITKPNEATRSFVERLQPRLGAGMSR